MSLVKRSSFRHGSEEYFCDTFCFLRTSIPDEEKGQSVRITCFSVSNDILVFGSSSGHVFGFKRRTRIVDRPHFYFSPSTIDSCTISHISILSHDLILLTASCKLVLYSISKSRAVWQTQPSEAIITAMTSRITADWILVLVGDASGRVSRHVIQRTEFYESDSKVLHEEMEGLKTKDQETTEPPDRKKHEHEVVQIDVMSDSSYLISTCFRSLILTLTQADENEDQNLNNEKTSVVQVGRNERKVCGRYGAVFCPDQSVIYACRPSSHLIRASPDTGLALQTYILKRGERPPARKAFSDLRLRATGYANNPAAGTIQLGKLEQVTENLLFSYSSKSVALMTTDGSLLVLEQSLPHVVDVSCIRSDSQFEVFILFSDRSLVRIRNVDDPPVAVTSSSSDDNDSTSSLIDGVMNRLLPQALAHPVMSSILSTFEMTKSAEGDVIRVRSQTPNGLVNNEMDENEKNRIAMFSSLVDSKNQEEGEDESPPLVARRKVSKKSGDRRVRSRESGLRSVRSRLQSNASSSFSSLNVSRVSVFSGTTVTEAGDQAQSSVSPSPGTEESGEDKTSSTSPPVEEDKQEEPVDDNEQFLQILNAYREKSGMPRIQTQDEETDAPDALPESTNNVIPYEQNNEARRPSISEHVRSSSPQRFLFRDATPDPGVRRDSNHYDPELRTETEYFSFLRENTTSHPIPDLRSNGSPPKIPASPKKWRKRLPSKLELNLDMSSVVWISAFNDDMRDGVALLSVTDNETSIHIFPGGRRIRCPRPSSGSKGKAMDVNCQHILLLYDDGTLFRSTNWSNRGRRLIARIFGPRFERLECSRTRVLTSLSVNTMDNVCWSPDSDGMGWLFKLGSQSSCLLARDDSSLQVRLKTIVVSPRNSAIVWAMDDNQRLYCRAGIFNDRSDRDSLIAGVIWVPVDDLPDEAQLLTLTAGNDCVWIICRKKGQERLFKRMGINTPVDYIGSHWQEFQLPVESGVVVLSGVILFQ